MDREKIIKGLEVCVDRVPGKYTCYKCPYETDGNDCEINLTKDALALLKEQEAVEPFHKCIGNEFSIIEDSHYDYCPYCGKPITWEGR